MKNEEKYKTTEERQEAFCTFCRPKMCSKCPCYERINGKSLHCILRWLALEAEDDLFTVETYGETFRVVCDNEGVFTMPVESVAKEICAKLNSIVCKWHNRLCEKGSVK